MTGQEVLANFKGKNVVILGDIMLDRYLYGMVDRISPEAPVPVMDLQQIDNRIGGAANVAVNLSALGINPYLCGIAGHDREGEILMHEMQTTKLSTKGIIISNDRRTTLKTRVISQGQHLLRVDREDSFSISDAEKEAVKGYLNNIFSQLEVDAFVFQDYNKGLLDDELIRWTMAMCQERKIPTLVDPKKDHLEAFKGVTLFKPNLKEVNELLKTKVTPQLASLKEAAMMLKEKLHQEYTLITLGKDGLFLEHDGEGFIEPTIPRNIVDVCGAGDTVLSIAAAGLASSTDSNTIAKLANLAGGQVCEKVGVVTVEKGQLIADFVKIKG